jgi:predicted secreted protein
LKTLNRSTFLLLALLLALLVASPANAMMIEAPDIAENGSVIPVKITLDQPMTTGQRLDLLVNGELAAQVRVVEGKLTFFTTRVKGSKNNTTIVARVIANGRELDSGSLNVVVNGTVTVSGTPSAASPQLTVRTQPGDIKLLMASPNGFAGTLVVQDAGFRAEVSGSAVISRNPFVALKGEFSDQVSASIDGRTQQDVVARAQPSAGAGDDPKVVGGSYKP